MTTNPASSLTSTLIAAAVGVCVIATAGLIAFPGNQGVWQAGTWTLVSGLVGLLVLVPSMAYLLLTRRVTRTKGQIASFAVGLACLAIVAIGSF